MRFPSISSLLAATLQVARRFPLPMAAALVGSSALIFLIEIEDNSNLKAAGIDLETNVARMAMTAALGLSLLIGLTVWSESRNWGDNQWRKLAVLVGGVLFLGAFYWFLNPKAPNFEYRQLPRYLGLLAVAHLLVAFAPYLNQRSVADFWEYNRQLFTNLVTGAFYTLVLWFGLSAALLAVDQLFDADISGRRYPELFILLAGIFNTIYFLFHLPTRFEFGHDNDGSAWAFQILIKYILIPITVLYFVILYAYSAKIGLTWSLPKGWVSSLVLGFAAAAIFTWLLNFALARAEAGAPHGTFARWTWPVMLPMVLLLFVGVGRRISDYGVTESRFAVAHLGLWLLVCGVYFVWSKRDNIKFVPVSLAAFVLVALYGPLSMFSVSERSQTAELQQLLEKNGRWANGQAQPAKGDVPGEDFQRINDVLDYLGRRIDFKNDRPAWLAAAPDTLFKGKYADRWEVPAGLREWLQLTSSQPLTANTVYCSVQGPFNKGSWSLPTAVSTVFQFDLNLNGDSPDAQHRSLRIADNGEALLLYAPAKGGEAVLQDSFPVTDLLKSWRARDPALRLDSLEAFAVNSRDRQAWLLVNEASYDSQGDTLRLTRINASLFLKEK